MPPTLSLVRDGSKNCLFVLRQPPSPTKKISPDKKENEFLIIVAKMMTMMMMMVMVDRRAGGEVIAWRGRR